MSFPFVFGLFITWFFWFMAWHLSNNALNNGDYIDRHWVEPMIWTAQWGMWVPLVLTVIIFIPWGIALTRRRVERVGWTTRIDDVPTFSTTRPDVNFEPTPAERDMERQVDDALRRDT